MKKLTMLLLLSLSLLTMSVQASEIENTATVQPTFNTDSDWWVAVSPEDPDYVLYKNVEVNCFCK